MSRVRDGVRKIALLTVAAGLVCAGTARGSEVEVASSGTEFTSGYFFLYGPFSDPLFGGTRDGAAIAVYVNPTRSAAPTRLDLAMFHEVVDPAQGITGPLRIGLHQVGADGRPAALLAATTVDMSTFPRGFGRGFASVPVPGWPRLQAGTTYAISAVARTGSVARRLGWYIAAPTATVPQLSAGRLPSGAEEPQWSNRSDRAAGIRVIGQPERETRLTANGLVANVAGPAVFLTPSARLIALDPQEPVSGRTIQFSSGGKPLCSAVTAADGTARCGLPAPLVGALPAGGAYQASFAGDEDFLASSAEGTLVK